MFGIPGTLGLPRTKLRLDLLQRVEDGNLSLGRVQFEPFEPSLELVHALRKSGRLPRLLALSGDPT